ncbi:MAG: DUF2283 domain-containing protein [Rhodocyclaceae bacterium]|jgi:uncharacterized protein YuzE|nr:DUF2283 domain-containing protein [Rhodocyclaceae bacterium]
MKLSYDPLANVAYLRFHEKRGPVTTLQLSDSVNVDLAADGTIYGIELLNANEQLSEDDGRLIVETGSGRREMPLAA